MLFENNLRQTKSLLKIGGSFEDYCFLLLGKQTPFSCWKTGSKASSSATKSIPICKAKSTHIQLTAWGTWNTAFSTRVTNPVYPAGRTSLLLSWRKHNWTPSNCSFPTVLQMLISLNYLWRRGSPAELSLAQSSQVNVVIDFYWVTGTSTQR